MWGSKDTSKLGGKEKLRFTRRDEKSQGPGENAYSNKIDRDNSLNQMNEQGERGGKEPDQVICTCEKKPKI